MSHTAGGAEPHAAPTRKKWYKTRAGEIALLLIGAVVFLVVAVIVVGSFIWNASPQKALLDAAHYAMNRPGTYHVRTSDSDVIVTMRGDDYALDGTYKGTQVAAVASGGRFYVKSDDPAMFLSGRDNDTSETVANTTLDIKDKWISIDPDKSLVTIRAIDMVDCILETKRLLKNDAGLQGGMATTYLNHSFLNMKKTADGATTTSYDVGVDRAVLQEFYDATGQKELLTHCDDAQHLLGGDVLAGATMTVVLADPDNILKEMTVVKDGKKFVVTANYDTVPVVTVPSDTVDIDQVAALLFRSYLKSFLGNE